MWTRREFLRTSSLLALAPTVPGFVARSARAVETRPDERILVVVQLDGGNDGINTVVPFCDDGYARHRRELRIAADSLHKLTDSVGLHPSLRGLANLVERGKLAIVQGVGYPNPNRSHDVSMAIWQTGHVDPLEHTGYGWLGRSLDSLDSARGGPVSMLVGDETLPQALVGRRALTSTIDRLDELIVSGERPKLGEPHAESGDSLAAFVRRTAVDAYATADLIEETVRNRDSGPEYPATELSRRLSLIARLIKVGLPTRVFYAMQGGYDTHGMQLPEHSRLLGELSGALESFLDDLTAAGLAERVAAMCFSEFGRRVAENASLGTDHGTAGPVLVAGASVQPGLHGPTPSLTDLEDGDLKMTFDFRQVYASILSDWFNLDASAVLGRDYQKLPLFAR